MELVRFSSGSLDSAETEALAWRMFVGFHPKPRKEIAGGADGPLCF